MLEIKQATFQVSGQSVLRSQSLTVNAGTHMLLLGPSGCGKTTLLNLAAGLLRATTGDVVFQGKSYRGLTDGQLDALRANHFGFVFQRLHLIGHLTVAQNIAVAQVNVDQGRIEELLTELGLQAKASQCARDLSVGEAQRVAIARAIVNQPKIIFADEPTSALDDINTDKIMNLLFAQAEKTGAAIIAATHDARIKGRFAQVVEMAA